MKFEGSNETPPLPPVIRGLLERYPDLLIELRQALRQAVDGPGASPRFERALWALRDTLGDMMSLADADMAEADERGDPAASASLAARSDLIGKARSFTVGLSDTKNLKIHCDTMDGSHSR